MGYSEYQRICYLTEQREENVTLRNTRTGMTGHSMGCTYEGNTVQVKLDDGSLDSWGREDILMVTNETGRMMTRVSGLDRCTGSMD